jgi:hypothetical protein
MLSCCFLRPISGATVHVPRKGTIGENVSTSQVWRKQMCARAQINSLHSKSYSRLAWSIPNVSRILTWNSGLYFAILRPRKEHLVMRLLRNISELSTNLYSILAQLTSRKQKRQRQGKFTGKYRHNHGVLVLLNNALEQPFSQMHNYIFLYIRVIDLLQKQLGWTWRERKPKCWRRKHK